MFKIKFGIIDKFSINQNNILKTINSQPNRESWIIDINVKTLP